MVLIQMGVVECLEIKVEAAEDGQIAVYMDKNSRRDLCTEPDETYVDEAGAEYELDHWSVVPAVIPARSQKVKRAVRYDQVEGTQQIPETMEIEAQEEQYGRAVTAHCELESRELLREEWQEGFEFTVTFHTYEAGYYWLGDRLIPYNQERPELEGCEELLLELAEVPADQYRITDIQWSGDPYEDAEGELCRDAAASGQKLVRDYRVNYTGVARFPAADGWQTAAYYRPAVQTEEESAQVSSSEVRVIPVPEKESGTEEPQNSPSLWERITRTLMITIVVGAVLFLGGLFMLGLVWVVKKARACYNKRKIDHGGAG